ncbi:MAG: hypothetical protein WC444_03985 [Candidatus Paceibacterota bacterium]
MNPQDIKLYDGDDEIVYSGVFNVYENSLRIESLYGFNFKFLFEEKLPPLPSTNSKDIAIVSEEKDITITFNHKIRNTLGGGTSNKVSVVNFNNGKTLLFSVYSSVIGDNTPALNLTVTFYMR